MKLAKICTFLLCFALLAGTLAACGNNKPETSSNFVMPTVEVEGPILPYRELSAAELLADMGAGWNLGNTLDGEIWDKSVMTPELHEIAWGNPVTTPEMIQLLVDTGFNTLRVPVTWEYFLGPAPDYKIDAAFLDRVQEVVDYGIDRDMYVILNMHHETFHYTPTNAEYESGKTVLVYAWAQIAGRFGGYSEKLIFEGMNEPRLKDSREEWTGGTDEARDIINRWNQAFVDVIRASGGNNVRRWLMVTTHAASADDTALKGFVMPDDDRTIVSVHAYTPWMLALNTRATTHTEFDTDNPQHRREIDNLFKRLDDFLISKGMPVIMGEMGIINKNNLDSRIAWTAYYTLVAAEYGVPCIWWDNGIKETTRVGEETFGIMDRENVEWWFPEIAQAMVENYN
jgi:endoglucanase